MHAVLTMDTVTHEDISDAMERIRENIIRTPVLTCPEANKLTGRQIFFKAEHLQTTGSFKARGAINAVRKFKESSEVYHPGVVSHSSGNHGKALAWAASCCDLPCTIVVPKGTPTCKKQSIQSYGAELIECYPSPTARVTAMENLRNQTGKEYISSCDHTDVIAGQGTVAVEFLEQVPDLDAILVAVSGGGLAAGIAVAAKYIKPDIKIILVSPEGKLLEKCLNSGEREWPNPPLFLNTIAEGIKQQQLGFKTFPLLVRLAEKQAIEVPEEGIIEGMLFSFVHMKVIEASAGAALAALFTPTLASLPAHVCKVGVILCGGNVDVDNLPWYRNKPSLQTED